MVPSETGHTNDDLSFFTRIDEPKRTAVMVAVADPETRVALAHHLRGRGYNVWTTDSGLDAYRTCVKYPGGMDVLVCDEDLPDLPPAVLFGRIKTRLPGLQCCVLASVTHRDSPTPDARIASVVLDVAGWSAGMVFVNATLTDSPLSAA